MTSPLQLIQTLTTAAGRIGAADLLQDGPMVFDREYADDGDGDDQTVEVKFTLKRNGAAVDEFSIDGYAWRELESNGLVRAFREDVVEGNSIESSLRAQLDQFENEYEHVKCGARWSDTHSCCCDDECPTCGKSISPTHSVHLAGLTDESPARYFSYLG
ncbi:hypothetical protein [Rubrivivax gelatinosus]|uniref:hypothetical protein n=1 Tax=Rubrivivax gelatinosus TaxID=28068 RepID=UPI0005C21EED|nr:hypothetical protein [Rubrivivax gelatinosus]MBG6083072.1 hypothetical protein [Rubrivivax gelatinosus]